MPNRRVVVVLGMHRSGTSAVTRGLKALGVCLGDNFIAPNQTENPKGFWEDSDVLAINERLLAIHGSSWGSLDLTCPPRWEEGTHRELTLQAMELLRRRLNCASLVGFKDPRTVRLLPFWQRVFSHLGVADSYVVVVRNPLSVASSLSARNGFPPEKSYLLWLEHVLPALSETEGRPRVVVDYDRLMESPVMQMKRIATALNIPWTTAVAQAVKDYAEDFLSSDLRHAVFRPEDVSLEPRISGLARTAYSLLQELAQDQIPVSGAELQERWGRLATNFQALAPVCLYLETVCRDLDEASAKLDDRNVELAAVQHELEATQADVAERDREIGALRGGLEAAKQEIVDRERQISELHASTSWRVTAPLRMLKRSLNRVLAVGKGCRPLAYRVARRVARAIYRRLPLSYQHKYSLKRFVLRHFGFLLFDTTVSNSFNKAKALPVVVGTNGDDTHTKPRGELFRGEVHDVKDIHFPPCESPKVSIIVPVYNKWRYTYGCLFSIWANSGHDMPYEVIIANDNSSDETNQVLDKIHGIRVINNPTNLGFLRNCNNAAKYARGRYLLLLNNDTEVCPGWLEHLVAAARNNPRVGLVGGKLLYADGRIQEAGTVMWADGWGRPYGRFESPADYEHEYVKEVDCVVGACMLIDRSLFESLGGFDEGFAPAYYEEFDLEFSIREAGFKVMYQPRAEIVHHESSSYGAEIRDRQSTLNHRKFCEKWSSRLGEQARDEKALFRARDRAQHKKIILVVDDRVPEYDKHAGALTTFQYLKLFKDLGFKVIFLPDSLLPFQPYTGELQQMGLEVIYSSFDFNAWIKKNGADLDYVWLARPEIAAKYLGPVTRYAKAKILYYTHDLHYLREERRYQIEKSPAALRAAQDLKKLEFDIFAKADCILTPSGHEADIISENFPDKQVAAIPAYYYESSENALGANSSDYEGREGLIFLGGFGHLPNVDAVLWFVSEVFPQIKEKIPGIRLCVAGNEPPPEIKALASDDIIVTGYVKNLEPLFAKARVFVSPLRFGAGVKGKIVTSMAFGVPVVTTSIGNEGLNLRDGEEAFVADDPAQFARKTIDLYSNEPLWMKLAAGAQACIRDRFSKERAKQTILETFRILVNRCSICGTPVNYVPPRNMTNLREAMVCTHCHALKRNADLARCLLELFRAGSGDSLVERLDQLENVRIYEIGHSGAIHDVLSRLPRFVCSEYFDDVQPGETHKSGVRCEDVMALTFADESFDLVVSQDVFEHVPDAASGFREVFRVLASGGYHVFTVPFNRGTKTSVHRAKIEDNKLRHLLNPVYHGDPIRSEGALVFTDFGEDLLALLETVGFEVSFYETTVSGFAGGYNIVFMARKRPASVSVTGGIEK